MAISGLKLVIVLLVAGAVAAIDIDTTPFDQNYHGDWGHAHLINESEVQLQLDQYSGGGFRSNLDFLSGLFHMKIKLSTNKSHGEIATFYLIGPNNGTTYNHNELDFEFYVTNDKYVLSTNVFSNDVGHREQAFNLWFDPTDDFHDYQILWNQYLIIFFVDFKPIRVFKNHSQLGLNYLTGPMHIYATMWTADWAGIIDYSKGPFTANYRNFNITACEVDQGPEKCNSPEFFWNQKQDIDQLQQDEINNIKTQYMYYDYCTNSTALECHI